MAETRTRAFSRLAKDIDTSGNIKTEGIASDVELGGGVTVYASAANLPVSGNTAGDQAFVTSTGRLYIFSGVGWYNVALINNTPTIQSVLDSNSGTTPFALATDGTPTTITITAVDSDGETITYASSADSDFSGLATISQSSNVFTITPLSSDSATTTSGTITFTATDGINTATSATQTFTLTFGAADNWKYATFSLGTNDTTNLQNDTFIDRSTNAHTVTATGALVQTAFHPYLDNWSVEFNSANPDKLTVTASSDFAMGTGDFTVEFFVYPYAVSASGYSIPFSLYASSSLRGIIISSYQGNWTVYNGSSHFVSSTHPVELNKWVHIACTRESSSLKLWVDGELAVNTSVTYNFSAQNPCFIGGFDTSDLHPYDGLISNVRIVKGTALYTSTFTPPTEKLTAITNTVLLTCQSNRFIDNSSSAHTFTLGNTPEIFSHNPFGQESEYATGENKGSVYIDGGTSTRLTLPSDTSFAFGTNAYSVEAWIYISESTTGAVIFDSGSASGSFSFLAEGGYLKLSKYGTGVQFASSAGVIKTNTWHHCAIVRSSTSTNDTRLYVDGVLVGTGTDSNNWTVTTTPSIGGVGLVNYTLNGYISDLRIVKGTIYGGGAVYTSAFTPPTSPIGNRDYTSVYLPMDNAGIYDKTGNNTVLLYADEATSTTQSKFANSTVYADGSGDYLRIDGLQPFRTGDFTVECWLYTLKSDNYMIFDFRTGNNTLGPTCSVTQSSAVMNISGNNMGNRPSLNTWHHIAMTRQNGVVRLFLDGVQSGNDLNLANDYTSDRFQTVSAYNYTSMHQNAYVEGLQILQGVAKYTANFTPPSQEQGWGYQAGS